MDKQLEQDAIAILDTAESSMRKLIASAAMENHYDELVWLAELAKRIAAIHPTRDESAAVPSTPRVSPADLPNTGESPGRTARSRPTPKKGKYPMFVTNSEKLTKIGWSKKNKAEYEHRAPKDSIKLVFEAISNADLDGGSFDVEKLTPISTPDGQEVPSYQIYMAIGWLIEAGKIGKSGRNEYTVTEQPGLSFDEYWANFSGRAH